VTLFDPDARTGSGWWHWVVLGIPASVAKLEAGAAGTGGSGLPEGASHVRNDYMVKDFGGAAPPEGDPPHRYVFAVHALGVESLGVSDEISPAMAGFNLRFHTIARALLIPVYGYRSSTALAAAGRIASGEAGQLGQQPRRNECPLASVRRSLCRVAA
jgi:Raf kinase inhibitor-like YbhB/YbcL family protein